MTVMTDSNICGYCGGDEDIAKIAKRMGYRPDVAFAQLAKAEQRIEQLEALLRHARCPNKDCIDGAYPFGPDRELHECEWCDERKALLAEDRE